jgi:hypothetical protein
MNRKKIARFGDLRKIFTAPLLRKGFEKGNPGYSFSSLLYAPSREQPLRYGTTPRSSSSPARWQLTKWFGVSSRCSGVKVRHVSAA